MKQITKNVYVETEVMGCNHSFITTKEGVVMVDSPLIPEVAIAWREEIAKRGEVIYIINTESHLDHFLGNYFFPGKVISHIGMREVILATSLEEAKQRLSQVYRQPISLPQGYHFNIPVITFSDHLYLYLGEHTLELIHMPGHTPYQIAVYLPEERVIFTGDNVFHKVQTFLHQADPDEWLSSLKRIEGMEVDIIIPGHGEVCGKDYIKEQASFIEEWVGAVKEAIKRGWSKEEAMERVSFLHRYPMDKGLEDFGGEVQRWNVERLYDWLTEGGGNEAGNL